MNSATARTCPICGNRAKGATFPYATSFNHVQFLYLKCAHCSSVFVDPVPDANTFTKMYAKSAYHDHHYIDGATEQYTESAVLLRKHINPGALVLDYGCGVGNFLKACALQNLVPFGVEFDSAAASFASRSANCQAISVEEFNQLKSPQKFDAIHLGDVLEHLSEPSKELKYLLTFLRPGGILFVEGPLEENPSPVVWAARLFGSIKRILKPSYFSSHAPTHLFRTDARAQKDFFSSVDKGLTLTHWRVYETGWPYSRGGLIKRCIASLAVLMGGHCLGDITFGNRFKAILIKA